MARPGADLDGDGALDVLDPDLSRSVSMGDMQVRRSVCCNTLTGSLPSTLDPLFDLRLKRKRALSGTLPLELNMVGEFGFSGGANFRLTPIFVAQDDADDLRLSSNPLYTDQGTTQSNPLFTGDDDRRKRDVEEDEELTFAPLPTPVLPLFEVNSLNVHGRGVNIFNHDEDGDSDRRSIRRARIGASTEFRAEEFVVGFETHQDKQSPVGVRLNSSKAQFTFDQVDFRARKSSPPEFNGKFFLFPF